MRSVSFPNIKTFKSERSGSVAVEGAFIFPVLLTIIYGIIELCRALYANFELDYAIDKTSRYAMVHTDAKPSEIEAQFNNELVNLNANNLISFNISEVANADNTRTANISASYKFELFIPLASFEEFTFNSEQTFMRF